MTAVLDDLIRWYPAKAATRAEGHTEWCPHAPFPNQRRFLDLTCREALYGGAAGGGKSDAMLMAALQYVDQPGYNALLFRRTYSDLALPDAIMDRSHQWLANTKAHWNGETKTWAFPSGAKLTFGYLDTERDKFRYQGAQVQFVGFDELTQFPIGWYLYLFSRQRRLEGSTVPIRMRGATNPGGIGHAWVKHRFIDSPESRMFVPSRLEDNPHIDQTEYRIALAELDPTTRMQLEDGAWVQDTGGLVYQHFDPSAHVRPLRPNPDAPWFYLLGLDFGFTDDCAFVVVGWQRHSPLVWVLESFKLPELDPTGAAEHVEKLRARYKFDRIVGDLGGLGKGYGEEMRRRWAIPIEAAEKKDKQGYIRLLNGALAHGQIALVAGMNDGLATELEELPWADDTRAKEAPGFPNHLTDALLYSWRAARAYQEQNAPPPEPQPGSPEWERKRAADDREAAMRELDKRAIRQGKALLRQYGR